MKNSSLPDSCVVLVDDDPQILLGTSIILKSSGIANVVTIQDSRELVGYVSGHRVSAVVLDLTMPYISGSDLLPELKHSFPDMPVIIMTAVEEIETAIECMKQGAFDYLLKPVDPNRLISSVKRAFELFFLRSEVASLKEHLLSDSLLDEDAFSEITTRSKKMRAIFKYIEAVGITSQPVLISGETGSGKELIARAIHRVSARKGSFVALNIAGVDDAFFSDMLFGHKKGAFSGADASRDGLIVQAAGGTIFLDEIGDLSESSQVKLLRLLQEHEYYPIGADKPSRTDARVVVATNCDLDKLMADNRFRKDLYFRLRAHQIDLPPLRERMEDLPLLVNRFLEDAASVMNRKKTRASCRAF